MRRFLKVVLLTGCLLAVWSVKPYAQFSYSDAPLLQVLKELGEETEFVLLYREALVRGKKITLESTRENVFAALKTELLSKNLDLLIDEGAKQVVIYRRNNTDHTNTVMLSGYVIDAATGERLPYATVQWSDGSDSEGVAANESGFFRMNARFNEHPLTLKASYIGYEAEEIILSPDKSGDLEELTLRLSPGLSSGMEVIVSGFRQFSDNSSVQKAVDINTGAILGEPNTIKSLQQLPSVTAGPALSEGIHVRGSPKDGFQVLLDGITIYNQTHLFGLFDNFNADAIQTSGLYYGITPANYQAPVGGTLSLITRTGSVSELKAAVGISNTSWSSTIEGPLRDGALSFLLSGRGSIVDQVNWLGNEELLNWGADVNRPSRFVSDEQISLRDDLVRTRNSSADFGDLHAKINYEAPGGATLSLAAYYGFDDIGVNAERLYRSFNTTTGAGVEYRPVQSSNNWKNGVFSARLAKPIASGGYSVSMVGWSVFNTSFNKDDFTYTQVNPGTGALESFTSALTIESVLNELIARQDLEYSVGKHLLKAGLSYQYFIGEYFEDSFERPSFLKTDEAHKLDAYAEAETQLGSISRIKAGLRTHYYSSGSYLDISPRLNIRIFPDAILNLGAGYSRNFQYINRLSFSNVLSSDVWVMVDEEQPPAFVDNLTAGIYFEQEQLLAQLEVYSKKYQHLRLHEIDTFSVTNAFSSSPWFSNNAGEGRGIEFMLVNVYDRFEMQNSLSLSRMKLSNPEINDGKSFAADWDRTWQYSGTLLIHWTRFLSSRITQIYATGNPNKLNLFGAQNRERLGDYFRTDIAAEVRGEVRSVKIVASVSLFNVFDVKNPWYRDIGFGLTQSGTNTEFVSVPVEIYDLGFQPAFTLKLNF